MRIFKDLIVIGLAAVAGLYLINPTAGIFELLPDNLPLLGNIDEAAATLLLINAARYFGLDLTSLGRRESNTSNTANTVQGSARQTPRR